MVAGDVQEALDALAEELGRSLTLDSPDGILLAHSIRGDDSDRARVTSILRRSVAPDVHAWQLRHVDPSLDVLQQVPANDALDLSARRCLPVRAGERCLALLWLVDDGRPLAAAHLSAVRRGAAGLARLLPARVAGSGRLRVVATDDDRPPVVVSSEAELARAIAAAPPGTAVGVSEPGRAGESAGARLVRQAVLAARVAAEDPGVPSPAHWPGLGVYRRLDEALGPVGADPLAALDASPSGPMLLETLETFLDLAGDVRDTAERLRLHRSSLYYRLERLAAVLGADLGDGLVRLDLHLALKQRRWARVSATRGSP
ncbi:helix-turn-helix domain-containing protein [Nocardioides sp. cx-173]|uniref:helix-turn-helix domain-containing protein n=1 Tax=Nocardioides sp. cx-173 TaxID=2898796 RepID=UPI001E5580B0|nr:helix-turn-helix domain-containing protein [Nocardioides sp. cx-173]MCD4526175.1 helix-turn-helix domain-containing protein [Nocardioides sp. cx-173]UGB40610.1 helix-turn-helix domain-containing protein [Nocardioides sp. cx-173]